MKERECKACLAFYECKADNIAAAAGGWDYVEFDNKKVLCCVPAEVHGDSKHRRLERFSFYCLASVRGKKIGSKASWTGRTPKWCPLGRAVE